jgi:hypothetical protein
VVVVAASAAVVVASAAAVVVASAAAVVVASAAVVALALATCPAPFGAGRARTESTWVAMRRLHENFMVLMIGCPRVLYERRMYKK